MRPREASKGSQTKKLTVRMFSDELKRLKAASSAANQSLSDYTRSILLRAIPAILESIVVKELRTGQSSDESQSESGGRVLSAQNVPSSSRQKCIHGFKVTRGATQCFTCANMGVKLSQ